MTVIRKTIYLSILLILSCKIYSAETHNYNLEISEDLRNITVTIQLANSEQRLKARKANRRIFTKAPKECESKQLLNFSNRSIYLNSQTRCIKYTVKIQDLSNSNILNLGSRTVITTPTEWLFLPRFNNTQSINLQINIDDKHNVSVPWKLINKTTKQYELSASPESADSLMILGNFQSSSITHKNTNLRIAYLPGKTINQSDIEKWLIKTVDNIAQVYGRFPHPSPQIIISPHGQSWSRYKSPVPYARVVRDSGESVQFFIDQRQSLNAFNKDWTATHEFSHLMLPYIKYRNRWLSEGFASYYQNILMARGEMYSEKKAWQKLYDGFMRGKNSTPELSPNSAAHEGASANMKIYWSGAALFFVADLELRLSSNNTKSLDTTLDKLQACCLPSDRVWSGSQLMRKLDTLSETKVFSSLHKKYANSANFIDFETAFENLGISIINGRVRLSDDLESVNRRQYFMAPRVTQ